MRKKRTMKPQLDYKEYEKHLSPEDRAWIRQFNQEYYKAVANDKKVIITDPEMQAEAHRVHNSEARDLYSTAERTGSLRELSEDEDRFMQDASDEWSWENVYKEFGYKDALKEIFAQTIRDLDNKVIDRELTLARFLSKYLSLKKINNRKGR